MLLNIPYIKAWVDNEYVKGELGFTECYVIAVSCIRSRPHLFTIHTIDGAVYSRLPINSLYHKEPEIKLPPAELEPWGVIGKRSQILEIAYLKDYNPEIISTGLEGRYLFSIEPLGGGFSEDPEQSKTLHMLALENGQLALLPNNSLRFKDQYFTENDRPMPRYIRNKVYFTAQG